MSKEYLIFFLNMIILYLEFYIVLFFFNCVVFIKIYLFIKMFLFYVLELKYLFYNGGILISCYRMLGEIYRV